MRCLMAGPLNYPWTRAPRGAPDGKDRKMWVFDGEEWTQDDGGLGPAPKPGTTRPRYERLMPELQVVELEIVPVPTRDRQIPSLPIP